MIKKKLMSAVLAASLAAALAGCAGAGSDKASSADISSSDTTAQTTQEPATTEAPETQTGTESETEAGPQLYSDEMRDISGMELLKEMKIGWNLGNTLDSAGMDYAITDPPEMYETAWGAQYTSQVQIDYVIDSGFNVIRIPVTWTGHIYDDEDHTIEPRWMDRIQEVVDYAYKKGAFVILNTHHEEWYDPYYDNYKAAADELEDVWRQIGERFADYGDHLIFEGMNEPRKKNTGVEWSGDAEGRDVINQLERVFEDTIRSLGGKNAKRFLMLTGYAASSSENNLAAIQIPENDDRIIISVHAYIPYNFALNVNGTAAWNNDTRDIDNLMSVLDRLFISKGIPVIIGEMGAMFKDNDADRVAWAKYYIEAAKKTGAMCCWWDNHSFRGDGEKFGLLRCNGFDISWKFQEVVDALISAAYAD